MRGTTSLNLSFRRNLFTRWRQASNRHYAECSKRLLLNDLFKRRIASPLLGLLLLLYTTSSHAQQLAFPGAEGFGRFTSGGRGGEVLAVTNLNDDGEGSFRAAIAAQGARTIVFRVSGTLVLQSELRITNGDLTIAGQTAPGDGVCIRDYPLIIAADNVIIRYLRVRLGDVRRLQEDAVSCLGRKNLILDHCSLSWGIDEVASFYDNENATVQWCIVSESLDSSFHKKGKHGYGGIWGGKGASFHHNLFAHHANRNPRFNGSRTHGKPEEELVDFRNNVIYNWRDNSSYGGEAGRHNLVANYFKHGPATGATKNRIVEPYDASGKWFVADNFVEGFAEITANNWAGGVQGKFSKAGRVDAPHAFAPITTHTAEQAYELVLANAGAVLPKRDAIDTRIITEVQNGIATVGNAGIINSQTEVGGWPELHSTLAPKDEDRDGMPDDWEREHGLDPSNPKDRNEDFNGDGYSNLEDYLNTLPQRASRGF